MYVRVVKASFVKVNFDYQKIYYKTDLLTQARYKNAKDVRNLNS